MSLTRLVLRDFVIVSTLELEFTPGFTVLTGETGAGKSILIDALQLVTGGRSDVNLVREGAQRAEVSAEFDPSVAINQWLTEAGFVTEESLLLRRVVDLQGRSRAWINASAASAAQLRCLGEMLFDIHGQHAWQSLTHADAMRALLDGYAQVDTKLLAGLWQQWRTAQQQVNAAQAQQAGAALERERLIWQIGELEKLAPNPGEWEQLQTQQRRLANAQALLDGAQAALLALDDSELNACSQISKASELLRKHAAIEPAFQDLADVLAGALAQLEDSAHSLRSYLHKTELEPERLAQLDARLGLWLALARRYQHHAHELPDVLAHWQQQLQTLDTALDLTALQAAQEAAWQAYLSQARALSQARQLAAPKLASAISVAMQGLAMPGGRFEIVLSEAAQALSSGLDEVAFLVAGHAGSTPRALQKVASGGELSRLALAIAVTTSPLGAAQTLIFDEVDAGIGAAVAHTVGRQLQRLGSDRQVLAVTHLAQVAACADQQLVVRKQTLDGSTLSSVQALQGEARVSELARMLGGERLFASTLAHARELWQDARRPA